MRQSARYVTVAARTRRSLSALACLEPTVDLVDDVDAAATTNDSAVPIALLQRLEGIPDFHSSIWPISNKFKPRTIGTWPVSVNNSRSSPVYQSNSGTDKKIGRVISYTAKFREVRETEGSLPVTANSSDVVR